MKPVTIRLAITIAITWVLLSGLFKTQFVILGILTVLLVVWLSERMGVTRHRGQPVFVRVFSILRYWSYLIVEIFKSNVAVTKLLLNKNLSIKPVLRTVSATPNTEMGRVVYANSITLTPGTTAINFTRNGDILVHALHEDSLHELEGDIMAEHVRRIEREQDWQND